MSDSPEPRRVLVVGAGAAALAVAETARAAGFGGEVVLLGREPHIPYDRPPLSKQILSGSWAAERTQLRPQAHLDKLNITVRVSAPAAALDEDAREVVMADGERVWYDELVIATGVDARTLPGIGDLNGVHVLRELDHALALRDDLRPGRRLVVIGAGVLGLEVAAVATTLGVEVSVVDPLPAPMARVVGAEVGTMVSELHHEHAVQLILGVGVSGVRDESGTVTAVELDDGRVLPADIVLLAVGSRPATQWLSGGSLQLGGPAPADGSGGILCSESGRAAAHVHAAGDVAAWYNPRSGRHERVEHRLNASEQGRSVAKAMLSHQASTTPPTPYFWSDQYGLKLQSFGSFDPDDQFVVVRGSLTERNFIGTYLHDGTITAVTGIGFHRDIRTWSSEIGNSMPQFS